MLNSYKFPRPRVYVRNSHEPSGFSQIDHLKFIASNVGPKVKTQCYNSLLDRVSNLGKAASKRKPKISKVSLNCSNAPHSSLKMTTFSVGNFSIRALVDTGSSHCLMSVKRFQEIPELPFTPLKVHMKVAGGLLKDNVVGSSTVNLSLETSEGKVSYSIEFLVAHATNGYDAILGATFLLNPKIVSAITPVSILLSGKHSGKSLLLENARKEVQANFLSCSSVSISPREKITVSAKLSTEKRSLQVNLSRLFHFLEI